MSDSGNTKGMRNMESTILEMQKNLDEGHFIAFVSANEDPLCGNEIRRIEFPGQ